MYKNRYARLEAIEEIGSSGIAGLQSGAVLVVGCGALGSVCSMYLAGSGIGRIGIADFDTVDVSNLQRQVFYSEELLGSSKASALAAKMMALNSEIKVDIIPELITFNKALSYFAGYDFIIDGSDNPATKKMTAEVCEKLGKGYCIGGVREFTGQVMSWLPGHQGYLDVFGDIGDCSGILPCSVAGVLGPVAGVVASVQAAEAIKYLAGAGNLLLDKLFVINMEKPSSSVYSI